MATRKQVTARAKELGCTFEDKGHVLSLECPHRKVLAGSGLHYLDKYLRNSDRVSEYRALLDDMKNGLADCVDPDCDVCNG